MSSEDVLIDVRDLSKRYEIYATPRDRLKQLVLPRLYRAANRIGVTLGAAKYRPAPAYFREFWALKNVSFEVRRGETLGIIGRNGGGKSTLLQIIAGTMAPTGGSVEVKGRVAALLELGSGFNPEFSGRENVFLNGRILGLTQREIEDRYDQISEFADIGEFIDEPVKTYSSGMFLRLAFAVQAHIDAAIVIIDEALAVGDVFFRQKCYERLEQLRKSGAAILLVSHGMSEIEQYCERAILLDHGEMRFMGSSAEATKHYYLLHQPKNRGGGGRAKAPAFTSVTEVPIQHGSPPLDAFIDLTNKAQISNGQARCVGVALLNEGGQACNSFRQGDRAVFYYEFELADDIGVPICGITLTSERGVIVHGKNSLQFHEDVSGSCGAGDRVVCRQEIKLDLAPGEYVFQVGLAWLSEQDWANRRNLPHDEQEARIFRVCHLPRLGSFSVGYASYNGVNFLTHHGVANLPGRAQVVTKPPSAE